MMTSQKTYRAYIYPLSARSNDGLFNPYLDNFMDSLQHGFFFINRFKPSRFGIIQLFRFFPRIEYIFFNWIENLPDKKLGAVQIWLLPIIIGISRIRGIKIVWIMHNRLSHNASHMAMKKAIFKLMARVSYLILTHSSEGADYVNFMAPNAFSRILFIHHPVVPKHMPSLPTKRFDVMIWGTMHAYKGILNFLDFCARDGCGAQLKVLLAGKFVDSEYYAKVMKSKAENVQIINNFIEESQLLQYTAQSRYVLFPYDKKGVLSSGALMESVGMGARVIGPSVGAFRDLANEGIIDVFESYEDIINILKRPDKEYRQSERISEFVARNSWRCFGQKLTDHLVGKK